MRLAVVHKEKCKPDACGRECKKYCPVEKKELDSCVTIGGSEVGSRKSEGGGKARIDEGSCVGCGICVKRCPFGAIDIVSLPSVSEEDLVYRYGENGFALYGLPMPKEGRVLGLLGRNGIGKSTAVEILAGKVGKENNGTQMNADERGFGFEKGFEKIKGTELQAYFGSLDEKKIFYKPQNLSSLAKDVGVMELLKQRGGEKEIRELAKKLNVENILGNKMNKLSGGELQRVAILAASLEGADVYFFDEPLAFLDIGERLRVSDFIKKIGEKKTVVVVEHDLLVLDYLADYLNIFYGSQGVFGLVSGVKGSKVGVNSYLDGFLKEENLRIRDKSLNFNFSKNVEIGGSEVASWDGFGVKFDSGFELNVKGGKIYENHVVGILGKNGTGKTTFIRALVGDLEQNECASVQVYECMSDLEVSYKPQYLFTESEEIVRDIIFKEKVNKKMKSLFNLGVLESKKMRDLSGGELQRFSVARCLAKDADVYFFDEPSAYLDIEERISVARAIKDVMNEKGKSAFVVEHDLLLVSYLADSVINFSEIDNGTQMNADERRLGKEVRVCEASEVRGFEEGVGELLRDLDVTLRKDKESGMPRINKKGSVLDREQKLKSRWAIF